MKHKLLLLLAVLSITGCSLEELWHEDRSVTSMAFSVEQAREFFEKDYVDRLTKSQDVDNGAGRSKDNSPSFYESFFIRQQFRFLLKSKKLSLYLRLRNRCFGNRCFGTKYRKP